MGDAVVMTITERRMALTRRALAEAAGRLFSERGYDATTIEDITSAVDVSPRTFFRYFTHKEGVVTALAQLGVENLVAAVRRRPHQESFAEALAVSVIDIVSGSDAGPGGMGESSLEVRSPATGRAFFAMLRTTPALRARWLDEIHQHENDLVALLVERTPALLADPLAASVVASAVMAAVITALEAWAASPADTSASEIVRHAMSVLQRPLLEYR